MAPPTAIGAGQSEKLLQSVHKYSDKVVSLGPSQASAVEKEKIQELKTEIE